MKRIAASLMFFTRLPMWRIVNVPSEYFRRTVDFWSLTGWLTSGLMALVFTISTSYLPPLSAAILAVSSRLLLTGALHEDGLADFFDGFGGGTSRERILAIMKDSHIGSYGVIALIIYFLLLISLMTALPLTIAAGVIIAADVWSKTCASQIINLLPYARKEKESKNGVIYERMSITSFIISLLSGAAALLLLPGHMLPAAIAPVVTTALLILYMRHRINGYTGDCCGATFLISELSFYLIAAILS
ncbi:MAG: adenosylcobinamide-GDP ribazoletransferase [Lachnoclostridium sp.]|nr:adenosylcobinamide-GDP ribazoletransferase [Lachnoclostridium sp.]